MGSCRTFCLKGETQESEYQIPWARPPKRASLQVSQEDDHHPRCCRHHPQPAGGPTNGIGEEKSQRKTETEEEISPSQKENFRENRLLKTNRVIKENFCEDRLVKKTE